MICWAHYGMTCVTYLFPRPSKRRVGETVDILLLAASLALGAVTAPALAWDVADGAIALMTVLNLAVLTALHKEVAEETKRLGIGNTRRKGCISCQQKHLERSQS